VSRNAIDHALDSLDRAAALCESATPELFLLRLARLVHLCERNALLRATAMDLASEFREAERVDDLQRVVLLQRLREILALAREQEPAVDEVDNAEWTAERVERALDGGDESELSLFDFPLREPQQSPLGKLADRLGWVLALLPKESPARQGDDGAMQNLLRLRQEVSWLDNERANRRLANPGSAWNQIRELVALHNPHPTVSDGRTQVIRYLSGVLGSQRQAASSYDDDRERALDLLRTLVAELRIRAGVRATHAAALGRYAWAATSFRRVELAKVAAGRNSRQAERNLTLDAAAFLYAMGLDVLTEVSVGVNRLDLVSFQQALLIEAKRYGQGGGKRVVLNGVRQLLDYASRFRERGVITDNFLLVYRLGGTRVELPTDPVQIGGHTVRFTHVDLAPASESGSKAPRVMSIAADDIIEAVGVTKRAAQQRKKSRRRRQA
jgi:hypothetical protein